MKSQFVNSVGTLQDQIDLQLARQVRQREALFQTLNDLQDDLANLNAVLLYPLILDDRLELIITLPDPEIPPLRRTVEVNKGVCGRRTAHGSAEPKARLTMVRASSCIWRRCSGPLKLSV